MRGAAPSDWAKSTYATDRDAGAYWAKTTHAPYARRAYERTMQCMVFVPALSPSKQVEITADVKPAWANILTPEAVEFVGELAVRFESPRQALLARRTQRQQDFDTGALPDFLPDTAHIRQAKWKV